jgi:hypothetical protein
MVYHLPNNQLCVPTDCGLLHLTVLYHLVTPPTLRDSFLRRAVPYEITAKPKLKATYQDSVDSQAEYTSRTCFIEIYIIENIL